MNIDHEIEIALDRLRALAQEALDVQNACNLSGVVHGFSRAISALRDQLTNLNTLAPDRFPAVGTDLINRHPVCVLWAVKIRELTGLWECDSFTKAHMAVTKMVTTP